MARLLVLTILILNSALGLGQEAEFKFYKKNIRQPGKVAEGTTQTFKYEFENVGDAPLLINDYRVSCPCTKMKFPSSPVLPGEKGELIVTFDTKDKIGYQDRKIEILSNAADGPHFVRFRLMVDNK